MSSSSLLKLQLPICNRCFTTFKRKRQYDEHSVSCEFLSIRGRELNQVATCIDPIPNKRMMYELVKNCMFRIQQLETENKTMREFVKKEKKRVDIVDYLNNHSKMRPIIDFATTLMDALKKHSIQQVHLEAVFNGSIVDGVVALLGDFIDSNPSNFPMCAFSHKKYVFYVYTKNRWTEMVLTDLNSMFDSLSNQFMTAYFKWEQKRLDFIVETEEIKVQKLGYMKKILGNYMSDEVKYKELKKFLFAKLKQDIKSIVEYEFI